MKIVSFGDVHMATRNLARMDAVMRDTDLIIVSGDLTNFGGADDAQFTVEIAVNDGIFKITPHAYPLLQRSLPARSAIDAGPATTRTSQSR